MNALQTFNNEDFGSIRTLLIDNEPWFVGRDVALALGYSDTVNALKRHVDGEDKHGWQNATPSDSLFPRQAVIINESGLYSLILSSKLPNAKKFKRWVTNEVLPAIRKTGGYTVADVQEQREITRDDYIRAAGIVGSCRNDRLPYVLNLLMRAGLEIPTLESMLPLSDRDTAGETAKYIGMAISEYGLSLRRLAEITDVNAVQLSRILKGESKPKKERMQHIISAIDEYISQI